jgi:hypothetical protein
MKLLLAVLLVIPLTLTTATIPADAPARPGEYIVGIRAGSDLANNVSSPIKCSQTGDQIFQIAKLSEGAANHLRSHPDVSSGA